MPLLSTSLLLMTLLQTAPAAGNPIAAGWYADPEVAVFGDRFWIFPTFSDRFEKQLHFDAFSSSDLRVWTKHERIVTSGEITWAHKAMWAPACVENDGKFYLFFSANDVHEGEIGGIGVAVADQPQGPYRDLLGKPLVSEIVNGAQPIDQAVFKDADGTWYLIYGGWGHCNLARLAPDFTKLLPLDDGKLFREITPEGYVEGPTMFVRQGKYYFMWSEGGWGNDSYQVAYAMADSIDGPWTRIGTVITRDPAIATSAGHHSVLNIPGSDEWRIVYHRRPAGDTARDHRVICIDLMTFNVDGTIAPATMTRAGSPAANLK